MIIWSHVGNLPRISCTRLIRQNLSPPGTEFCPAESKALTNPKIKIPELVPMFNCFPSWQSVRPPQVSLNSSAVSKMLFFSRFCTLRLVMLHILTYINQPRQGAAISTAMASLASSSWMKHDFVHEEQTPTRLWRTLNGLMLISVFVYQSSLLFHPCPSVLAPLAVLITLFCLCFSR